MSGTPEAAPNPRRVAAGKANRRRRRPLTAAGRERLRGAALQQRPWEHSTGPRSAAGKAQAVRNGKRRQVVPRSVREMRADLRAVRCLIQTMAEVYRQLCPTRGSKPNAAATAAPHEPV